MLETVSIGKSWSDNRHSNRNGNNIDTNDNGNDNGCSNRIVLTTPAIAMLPTQ